MSSSKTILEGVVKDAGVHTVSVVVRSTRGLERIHNLPSFLFWNTVCAGQRIEITRSASENEAVVKVKLCDH